MLFLPRLLDTLDGHSVQLLRTIMLSSIVLLHACARQDITPCCVSEDTLILTDPTHGAAGGEAGGRELPGGP